MKDSVLSALGEIVGKKNFLTDPVYREAYSYDGTPLLRQLPEAVLFPESPEQIAKILELANQEKFAVVPRGSGTGLSGGSVPVENSIVLVMTKWDRILEIDNENLTAWVEPGVITEKLQTEVEKLGLFYPPDPGSMKICTIGGNVAENAGGLRGLKYGVTKNYVLGIEAVLPNGELLRSGGKNVKDVAGYNLRDVMIGSEGTLGVFTKILLRLIPKPQKSVTMTAYFDSILESGKAVSDIIAAHVVPAMMEFLDHTTINCVEDYTKIGLPRNSEAILIIELDGKGAEVDEDAAKVLDALKRNGSTFVKVASSESEALTLKSARRSAFSALARVKPTTILEDATVPRSELPVMIEKVKDAARNYDVMIGNFGHAGDGNLHPTCLTDERDSKGIENAHRAFDFIFNEAIKLGGTITGEHGTGLAKKEFLGRSAGETGIRFMEQLKSVVDENNILNPGKIITMRPRCEGTLPRRREDIPEHNHTHQH
ncbi:MAG: lactate dehydrogenase [Chlorobiota bacterium]|nr:MAG: FAD-binding protein [Chlorobiota bacterium]